MPSSLITMAEFWLYTRTSLSVEGFEAAYLIPASEDVRKYCDTDFGVQTVTDERRLSPLTINKDLRVSFLVKPVSSVSVVYLVFGSTRSELSISEADLFSTPGYLLIPFGSVTACVGRIPRAGVGGTGFLSMGDEYITESTYIGGGEIPVPVKQAVAYLAWEAYLMLGKIGDTGDPSSGSVKSYSIGSYSETKGRVYEGAIKLPGNLGWGTALSQRAEEKLVPYGRPGVEMLGIL